jgi:hypothetical protein
MKKMLWLALALGLSFAFFLLTTYVHPEFLCILLALLLLLALVPILVLTANLGFTRWRKDSLLWPLPALICLVSILSIYGVPPLGRSISDWRFEKHLSEYSAVADGLQSGNITCATPCIGEYKAVKIKNRPPSTRAIFAVRCDDGGTGVVFLADYDVPLLHAGYLFRGFGQHSDCGALSRKPGMRMPYLRQISGPWYRFSDQPGL